MIGQREQDLECARPPILDLRAIWRPILALVLVSALVQSVMLRRVAVPALDALRSVAAAEALLQAPTMATLAAEPEPPLFPLWLATVHRVRLSAAQWFDLSAPNWGTSASAAAALPLLIWVVPVYLFARAAFGNRIAIPAGFLGGLLPTAAQLGAEGLADSLFLLLFASAVAALVASGYVATMRNPCAGRQGSNVLIRPQSIPLGANEYIRPQPPNLQTWTRSRLCGMSRRLGTSRSLMLLSGMLVGLAMLVRVEAVLLLAAAGVVALTNRREALRRRLFDALVTMSLSGLGVGLVLGPWLIAAKALTPGAAVSRLCSRAPARDGWVFNQRTQPSPVSYTEDACQDEALNFDSKEPGTSTRKRGFVPALTAVADEYLVATGYALLPLAAFGVLRPQGSRRWTEWDRFAFTGTASWLIVAFVNASATGYLSSRHLLPGAVFLLPRAAMGWQFLGDAGLPNALADKPLGAHPKWRRWLVPVAVLLFWSLWCLQPIHSDRSGHRDAGAWIADHATPTDHVLDTWGWTALYSRRPTYRYDAAREAFRDPRLNYVVVEQRELDSGSSRAATLHRLLSQQAECVARFDPPQGQSPVLIFQWRPAFAHNGAIGTGRR